MSERRHSRSKSALVCARTTRNRMNKRTGIARIAYRDGSFQRLRHVELNHSLPETLAQGVPVWNERDELVAQELLLQAAFGHAREVQLLELRTELFEALRFACRTCPRAAAAGADAAVVAAVAARQAPLRRHVLDERLAELAEHLLLRDRCFATCALLRGRCACRR